MKKFFTVTKFLWIGAIMGAIQQLLGYFDYILYQTHNIFSFADIMDSLSLYAAIILLVIRRDVPPKHQLRDLILFFVGLDLFYYLYIFVIDFIALISGGFNPPPGITDDTIVPFSRTIQEIGDFIYWTSIGLAAAVWAYVATKLRNIGKKTLYIIMLLPLFAVMVLLLIGDTYTTIMYFITQGQQISSSIGPHGGLYDSYGYTCELSGALTSLVSLIVCLYAFLKKPTVKKNHTQKA